MANAKLTFYLQDIPRFYAALSRVEKVPQRAVTKAAGKGATVVRKAVRGAMPVDTGAMKRGIVRKGERRHAKGKYVYDLMFDPKKNDVFHKAIKNPGEAGGQNKKAYYPASMEYGFLTRDKAGNLKYEGRHFMRDAPQTVAHPTKQTIIKTFTAELEKEWQK